MTRMTNDLEASRETIENAIANVVHARKLAQVLEIKVSHLNGQEIRSGALADSRELQQTLAAAWKNITAINRIWSEVMEDTGKPKPNTPYSVFTADTDPAKAKAEFIKRFGYEPEEVIVYKRMLWVGPHTNPVNRGE